MKATEPTLSRHLLAEARKFILYPERVRKDRVTGAVLNRLLEELVASREWVVESTLGVENLPQEVGHRLFDEHYSKVLLERIPGMAVRTGAVPILR